MFKETRKFVTMIFLKMELIKLITVPLRNRIVWPHKK